MTKREGEGSVGGDLRGDFTRKIDQELILRNTSDEERQVARINLEREVLNRAQQQLNAQQMAELEAAFAQVLAALSARTEFLQARFPNLVEAAPSSDRGIRYRFARGGDFQHDAYLEFRVKDNELHQALFVECSLEVLGKSAARNDYITFPVQNMRLERVKKFVEKKILDFIQAYLE